MLTGTLDPDAAGLGKLESLAGVRAYPARIKCALLGWMAWKDATAQAVARDGAGSERDGSRGTRAGRPAFAPAGLAEERTQ